DVQHHHLALEGAQLHVLAFEVLALQFRHGGGDEQVLDLALEVLVDDLAIGLQLLLRRRDRLFVLAPGDDRLLTLQLRRERPQPPWGPLPPSRRSPGRRGTPAAPWPAACRRRSCRGPSSRGPRS